MSEVYAIDIKSFNSNPEDWKIETNFTIFPSCDFMILVFLYL